MWLCCHSKLSTSLHMIATNTSLSSFHTCGCTHSFFSERKIDECVVYIFIRLHASTVTQTSVYMTEESDTIFRKNIRSTVHMSSTDRPLLSALSFDALHTSLTRGETVVAARRSYIIGAANLRGMHTLSMRAENDGYCSTGGGEGKTPVTSACPADRGE